MTKLFSLKAPPFQWLKQSCSIVNLGLNISRKSLSKGRNFGCKVHGKLVEARVEVKTFVLYPEFSIGKREWDGLSKWKLRALQGDGIKMIREDLQLKKPIKTISSSHFHGKMYTQVTQQELLEFLLKS